MKFHIKITAFHATYFKDLKIRLVINDKETRNNEMF